MLYLEKNYGEGNVAKIWRISDLSMNRTNDLMTVVVSGYLNTDSAFGVSSVDELEIRDKDGNIIKPFAIVDKEWELKFPLTTPFRQHASYLQCDLRQVSREGKNPYELAYELLKSSDPFFEGAIDYQINP